MWVGTVHTKSWGWGVGGGGGEVRHRQVCTRVDSEGKKKQFFNLPHHGIEPCRVFGSEFRLSNHWAMSTVMCMNVFGKIRLFTNGQRHELFDILDTWWFRPSQLELTAKGHICFVHFVVPIKMLPWEIRVALPKESQLQQCRATQP